MNKKARKVFGKEVTATVNLSVFGKPLQIQTPVPTGKMRPERMLPVFHNLTKAFMDATVDKVRSEGLEISCAKGCAACCRHLVPVSEIEARRLYDLVNEMPEPQKSTVTGRFAQAKKQLTDGGLLGKLQNSEQISTDDYREIGLKYLEQRIACPFLENEACLIHRERPIVCREHLVVSPAENCSRQNGQPIKVLRTAFKMSEAVRCFNESQNKSSGWIPLILALDWADAHPERSRERPGTEIFSELLKNLINRDATEKAV